MATIHSSLQTSSFPFRSSTELRSLSSRKSRRFSWVRCSKSPSFPSELRQSRRLMSLSLLLPSFLLIPDQAFAGGLMDKYMKRKKLDPLEAYIPAVILTEFQIKDLDKSLDVEKPEYGTCRQLLRSGPAASLRVNIRAVAQYASDAGNGKAATDDVDECLRALEDLDSLLLRASRNNQDASVKTMKTKIGTVLIALDSLLQTVPSDVLNRGREIADAYRTPEDEPMPTELDPEMKLLESLLYIHYFHIM